MHSIKIHHLSPGLLWSLEHIHVAYLGGSLDGFQQHGAFFLGFLPTIQVDALNSTMLDQQVSELRHVDTLGPLFAFRNGTIHLQAGRHPEATKGTWAFFEKKKRMAVLNREYFIIKYMALYKWLYYLKSYNISTLLWKMLQNVDILQGGLWDLAM